MSEEPANLLLLNAPEMAAIFSAQAHLRAMFRFEAALARAQARLGLIPEKAVPLILAQCNEQLFDLPALASQAILAGTPAIPLVRMLTERVGEDAGKFVHWGATSQDVIDTAFMLQMRDGLDLLLIRLLDLCQTCATLAQEHRQTLMAGRTLLQQALPITFGLKAARWLSLLQRLLQALQQHRQQTLALQFGGAVGTLAALGDAGPRLTYELAQELHLPAPDLPWHTERDRIAAIASTLGLLAGAFSKIAGDLLLLAQTEVAELSEQPYPGKGTSSALPQKHNPVDATFALASARLALGFVPILFSCMAQDHERAAGAWQAEWAAIPDLFRYTASSLQHLNTALTGLQVDRARMHTNLALTHGLIMAESLVIALAPHIGRPQAQQIVRIACEQTLKLGTDLHQTALADPQISAHLSPEALHRALDPAAYLGSTNIFIDRVLATYHRSLYTDTERNPPMNNKNNSNPTNNNPNPASTTYFYSSGVRLAYRIDGPANAPTLVLINSLGTTLHMWDPQIPFLQRSLRIVRYDTRGHGASDVPPGPYTIEQLAGDLLALLDTLHIQRAHICGISLGGMIALSFAATHPDRVSHAIFANTAAKIGTPEIWNARISTVTQGGMASINDPVLARFLSHQFRQSHPDIVQHISQMLQNTDPLGYIAASQAVRDADLHPLLGTIDLPALIIAGALDESTPPHLSQELYAAIAGSRLVIFPEVAHLSNIEQPYAFSTQLLSFLLNGQSEAPTW